MHSLFSRKFSINLLHKCCSHRESSQHRNCRYLPHRNWLYRCRWHLRCIFWCPICAETKKRFQPRKVSQLRSSEGGKGGTGESLGGRGQYTPRANYKFDNADKSSARAAVTPEKIRKEESSLFLATLGRKRHATTHLRLRRKSLQVKSQAGKLATFLACWEGANSAPRLQ